MSRWKEDLNRRYRLVFGSSRGAFVDNGVAGSALIQACEKAGVTIPRYVQTNNGNQSEQTYEN